MSHTEHKDYDGAKLGMWLFLFTELLLFGGLFVAYAVFRANHPDLFHYARYFLDWRLGGLNTLVLIGSSPHRRLGGALGPARRAGRGCGACCWPPCCWPAASRSCSHSRR